MTLRVIRNKNTHEFRAMWEAPNDPAAIEPMIDTDSEEEYVELRNMTHASVMQLAEQQSGGRAVGRIVIHNDRVEAFAPTPRPSGLLGELHDLCKRTGKAPGALTTEDIEQESHRRARLEHEELMRSTRDYESIREQELRAWREEYRLSEHPDLRSGFAPRLRNVHLVPGANPTTAAADPLPVPAAAAAPEEDRDGLW